MKLKRKRLDSPSLSGVLSTRRGALVLAVLCALAATGVLVFALGKYRHSVSTGAKQDTVLIATSNIPKGTPAAVIASQRMYKVTPVLSTQVSAGAIVNAAVLSGKVAASTIFPGQQLTSAEFTTVSSGGGVAAQLTPTERAVAVTLDAAHGTSALQTGDHVDVYGSFGNVVSLLVPDALVLKAPGGSVAGASTTSGDGTVLLGVDAQIAPRVMWVFDNGKLWLELRGVSATNPQATVTGLRQMVLGNRLSTAPTYTPGAALGAKP